MSDYKAYKDFKKAVFNDVNPPVYEYYFVVFEGDNSISIFNNESEHKNFLSDINLIDDDLLYIKDSGRFEFKPELDKYRKDNNITKIN